MVTFQSQTWNYSIQHPAGWKEFQGWVELTDSSPDELTGPKFSIEISSVGPLSRCAVDFPECTPGSCAVECLATPTATITTDQAISWLTARTIGWDPCAIRHDVPGPYMAVEVLCAQPHIHFHLGFAIIIPPIPPAQAHVYLVANGVGYAIDFYRTDNPRIVNRFASTFRSPPKS
jgi:hypothetical protein